MEHARGGGSEAIATGSNRHGQSYYRAIHRALEKGKENTSALLHPCQYFSLVTHVVFPYLVKLCGR